MSKLHKIILVIVLLTLVMVATGCDPDGDGTNALQDLKEDLETMCFGFWGNNFFADLAYIHLLSALKRSFGTAESPKVPGFLWDYCAPLEAGKENSA